MRMYQRIFIYGRVRRIFLVMLSVLLLCTLPIGVSAQEQATASRTESEPTGLGGDGSETLTPAQREAQSLAAALGGGREARRTAPIQVPLAIVPDQVLQPGKRLIVTLLTTSHLEARLIGGVQTFASPVEPTAATARREARRPLFLPAEQSAVALQILTR